jgi:hypothetical protein
MLTPEVLEEWEYSSRVTRQTRISLEEETALKLVEYLKSKPDCTEEYVKETKRLSPDADTEEDEEMEDYESGEDSEEEINPEEQAQEAVPGSSFGKMVNTETSEPEVPPSEDTSGQESEFVSESTKSSAASSPDIVPEGEPEYRPVVEEVAEQAAGDATIEEADAENISSEDVPKHPSEKAVEEDDSEARQRQISPSDIAPGETSGGPEEDGSSK